MRPTINNLVTGLFLVILAGCGTTEPSRFYILTAPDDSTMPETATPGPAVGVGPVSFPAYLDRPEIVHRTGDNQLHYAGAERWAEPLKTTFTRTLAENLAQQIPGDRVVLHPWPRSAVPEYQVTVNVVRFDSDAAGRVVLVAGWEVIRPADNSVVARNRSRYTEAAGALDYPAIVAAQSRIVQRLAQDISNTIR